MSTEATLPDILTDLMKSCEPHPLFDKFEAPHLKFHKYVESQVNSQLFEEVGTLNITENSSKEVLNTNFDKIVPKRRILLNWFLGTYSSPKNYKVETVLTELYEKGYRNVKYDVTKIKSFYPNWFQKNILRQTSFQYFDYTIEQGFLFEVDDKEKIEINTKEWSHI